MKKVYKSFREFVAICRFASLVAVATLVTTTSMASAVFQWKNIQVEAKGQSLQQVLKLIEKEANCKIVYVNSIVERYNGISVSAKDATVQDILGRILKETDLTYVIENNVITIAKKEQATPQQQAQVQQKREITGTVIDKTTKKPVAGATIVVVGTTDGAITDEAGKFALKAKDADKLEVSCVGMVTQIITVSGGIKNIIIDMDADVLAVDDVVVTGYFERKKESFTGSAKTMTGDQLRNVSSTNLLGALSVLDPSISIKQSNQNGSNPNSLPDIIIRGTNSLNTSGEAGVNTPLIVIDGVESDLRALYDIDIFDIESVVTLKDASATALYGEQAANGVILVNRKKSSQQEVRVSYNFTGKMEFADLSGYSMMNAREKLDFELKSNVYKDDTGVKMEAYNKKLAWVNSGIDTDWLSKPLRNSFSHSHSANVSGGGNGMSYQLSARYGDTNGVMKGDNRVNAGVGAYFSYNLNQKLIATLRADFTQNSTTGSNYGKFSDFVNANPYDSPWDEYGEYRKKLSGELMNPLYESTLASFSNSKDKEFKGSLNLRWNVLNGFYMTGFGSLGTTSGRADKYSSPYSDSFKDETDGTKRGSYYIKSNEDFDYLFKVMANYNRTLDDKGSMISINAGGELRKENSLPYEFMKIGFFNDKLTDPAFGSSYPQTIGNPTVESTESATVAFVSAVNMIFRNRYFVEGSYRLSGSSKFGKEQRTAPFWSIGGGWNLHREKWFENNKSINSLRLRASYGHTGSIMFTPYQAMTTYRYAANLVGKYASGANPITMGNEDLKWQTTKAFNVGLTSTWLDERLDVNLDFYNNRTVDMIVPISMPQSSGIASVHSNVGEQLNKGFELEVSAAIIRNKDWSWRLTANGAQNKNTLVKIGNALRSMNDKNAINVESSSPIRMFVEGVSSTMIYAVKSAGIDPATGREIYLKKDGTTTFKYDGLDKIALGDEEPTFRGAISSYLTYKGFSLNVNLQYSTGAYIYNSTRATRIEQINPKYNADRRAYTERWNAKGQVVNYLTIVPDSKGNINNNHSSRFVEKENFLNITFISLGYEFAAERLKRIGFKRLNLSVSMNDVANFSTVRQERGITYPFARGFSFTISPTF